MQKQVPEIVKAGNDLYYVVERFIFEHGLSPAEGAAAVGIALAQLAYYQSQDNHHVRALETVFEAANRCLPIFEKTDPDKKRRSKQK